MAVRSISLSSITDDQRSDSIVKLFNSIIPYISVEYLVVAGGGGGWAGGGGAGGLISSASPVQFNTGTYNITVGAGGAKQANGSASLFDSISATGGGRGGSSSSSSQSGATGGSGGGGGAGYSTNGSGGVGTSGQGNDGGSGKQYVAAANYPAYGGGGGGAGSAGLNGDGGSAINDTSNADSGLGGAGLSSSISGSSVTYAGGGGGGQIYGTLAATAGKGGSGGGGNGAISTGVSTAGTANTGGGGGGFGSSDGQPGGSGVVILKYPVTYAATFSAGVTQTTTVAGSYKISEITATSTTSETVTFAEALSSIFPARYYKLVVDSIVGGGTDSYIQLSEFQLRQDSTWLTGGTYTNGNGSSPANEGPEKAGDNSTGTKWLNFTGASSILLITYDSPVTVTDYTWWTANDGTWRDMTGWTLSASQDNETWVVIDQVSGFSPTTSRLTNVGTFNVDEGV